MIQTENEYQHKGKSTLTQCMQNLLHPALKSQFISIDDFYYPYETLGPNQRGPPGTHDLPWLTSCLLSLQLNQYPISFPKYDKTLHQGHGDRCPNLYVVQSPMHVFFMEGWLLGMQGPLFQKYAPLVHHLDHFVHVCPNTRNDQEHVQWINNWRREGEKQLDREGVQQLVFRIWNGGYKEGYPRLVSTRVFPNHEDPMRPKRCHVQFFLNETRKLQEVREL
ncbi:hypothetical protein HMI54_013707 [Coelomomyces lativittatus]|nr:hypothetical protein HMI54_013707 [Coelomomyces lativittatus]